MKYVHLTKKITFLEKWVGGVDRKKSIFNITKGKVVKSTKRWTAAIQKYVQNVPLFCSGPSNPHPQKKIYLLNYSI